ncbi:MAG: hypothetical protein FKGGLIKP_00525 [Sodalis sp. Fse]|nr:MAG: hypothetical protein FKGGLIKP_00525 [Sodalis sp. Fse]
MVERDQALTNTDILAILVDPPPISCYLTVRHHATLDSRSTKVYLRNLLVVRKAGSSTPLQYDTLSPLQVLMIDKLIYASNVD